MPFTVETGIGDTDSNSFVTVAEFLSYWALRGKDLSDLDGEVIQAALIRATDYMELRFSERWHGHKVTEEQGLSWPRKNVYSNSGILVASDIVPIMVKKACMEYGKRALDVDLLPDPKNDPNVVSQTKTIGSELFYRIERLSDATVVEGSVTTDLPAATTGLGARAGRSNGTTALAATIGISLVYAQSEFY